jgi:hypothetical protein
VLQGHANLITLPAFDELDGLKRPRGVAQFPFRPNAVWHLLPWKGGGWGRREERGERGRGTRLESSRLLWQMRDQKQDGLDIPGLWSDGGRGGASA